MPALLYKQLDGTEKQLQIGTKPLIIGRLTESEIQVRDTFISRVHASLGYANNSFVLKDLGSTNGTYRNGARVYECNLATGDKIQVGNASLTFEILADGNGLLQQVNTVAKPRQIISPAQAAGLPKPSEVKMTIPVQIPPPPPQAKL